MTIAQSHITLCIDLNQIDCLGETTLNQIFWGVSLYSDIDLQACGMVRCELADLLFSLFFCCCCPTPLYHEV